MRISRAPEFLAATVRVVDRHFADFLRLWLAVRSVRGWLRMPDAYLLYRLARSEPGAGKVVEIGSAWGRSSVFLAAGCRDARREGLIAIDPHTGDEWFLADAELPPFDSYDEFLANLTRVGVDDWVEPLVMTSDQAAAAVPIQPIRLLFIDGSHTYEAVSRDIQNWVPRLVDRGIVIFDDYPNPDPTVGVRRAVDELIASGLVEPTLRASFNLVWTRRQPSQGALPS